MSITLKPWKWSNGQTLSSKDLRVHHRRDPGRGQGVPGELGGVRPGLLPGHDHQHVDAERQHAGGQHEERGQPDLDGRGHPRVRRRSSRSAEWAKDSAERPDARLHQPGERGQDLQLPQRGSQVGQHLRDQPALADRLRAVQAECLQRHHRRVHHGAEPHLQRPARRARCPASSGCRSPPTPLSSTPSRAGRIDVSVVPPEDAPQLPPLKAIGYNYYGLPACGNYFAAYNFQDKTGDFNNIVSQLYFRQAMQHLEDQEGQIKAFLNGAGAPGYGPIPLYPQSPFLPANATTNPYPFNVCAAVSLLKANGWNVVPNGTDTCAKPGRRRASAGPASRPAPSWPST